MGGGILEKEQTTGRAHYFLACWVRGTVSVPTSSRLGPLFKSKSLDAFTSPLENPPDNDDLLGNGGESDLQPLLTENSPISGLSSTLFKSSPSPRSGTKLGLFSSGSNTSTPRMQSQPVSRPSLRCRTTVAAAQTPSIDESPKLQAKTTTPTDTVKTPRSLLSSNPSSPRSPLKFSIFRNSFKLRNSYGICLQSVKTGQGTTIYTAECSHAFHFSCIAAHVRKQGSLVCPVCNTTWKDEPLLMIHKNRKPEEDEVSHREHEEMAQAAVSNGKREDDMTMGPTKQCSLG
ncbi:hypothetical protein VitviT2T_022919 [Vitis vinifera]|uniref:RING-type domain-containing protein n=2 Tax=Vitis vinifera TaxID=29760 RepID=A0ABY9DB97_VITVI